MHTLPRLVTSEGEFRLPLAEQTAERLCGALLARDPATRHAALRDAVAADPALAIWGLVQARAIESIATADALAGYLAALPDERFLPECDAPDSARVESEANGLAEFADPAGCSLAVALLAEHFARDVGADPRRAYFLGLVHLGADWLAESSTDGGGSCRGALPEWLVDAAQRVTLAPHEQSRETLCVAQALGLVFSDNPDEWRAAGCESEVWIGRWAALGEAWGESGPWGDRLATLVERLVRLDALEQTFERSVEQAKLEALKELAYGAGHEINNPLANISARAQTLLADERDPERRRTLAAINTQAFRAHEMIADMMLFARPPAPKKQPCDLAALARKVADELAEQAADQQTTILLDLPGEPATLEADPTQLAVALRSLCVNSLEALVSGGQMRIAVEDDLEEQLVRMRVSDTGPGIPAELRPKIFDPYFSGREAGRGLGLGLSKCWRIVTLHAGSIDVEPGDAVGAVFTITLPRGGR